MMRGIPRVEYEQGIIYSIVLLLISAIISAPLSAVYNRSRHQLFRQWIVTRGYGLYSPKEQRKLSKVKSKVFLVCNHVTRRLCWGVNTIKFFSRRIYMTMEFSSQSKNWSWSWPPTWPPWRHVQTSFKDVKKYWFEASQIFLMEGNWVFLGVVSRCWNKILIWDCFFTAIFGNISMEDMKRMCNIGLNQTPGSGCYTSRNLNDFYTVSSVFFLFLGLISLSSLFLLVSRFERIVQESLGRSRTRALD